MQCNMKNLFILLASLVCTSVIKAQDIITLIDGTDIQAKVTVVGPSEVSYMKYQHLDGPTYIISINDILMITYENGEREVYASKSEKNKKSGLPQGIMTYNSWSGKVSIGGVTVDDKTLDLYLSPDDCQSFKQGRSLYTSGTVIGCIGAIPFGWCLGTMLAGAEVNTGLLLGSSVVMVGGLIMSYTGENKMKEAINKYNSSLALMPIINWSPTNPDPTLGLALCLTF